jgi:hypothetical protein
MANTEYAVFFATSMVSLSEHGAGLTVGTMSLIRKTALAEVGGWAEWCLTEDSELAIRLHAAGYGSIYLSRPYGQGLIPETFAGYKKQRFRWTYGPVQEFRHHARLFAPGRRRVSSALTARQRLHHANHGLDVALIGLRLLVVLVGVLAVCSMIGHHEIVPVPGPLWAAATSVLVASWVMRWLVYRRAVHATVKQAFGATVAYFALTHVISVASARASVGRSAAWQRTNKFRVSLSGRAVLRTVLSELVLGTACVLLAGAALVSFPHRGLTLALALAIAWQGITYLAAPVVAVIAEQDVRRQIVADGDRSAGAELAEVSA